jgi:phage gp36-like protein
MIFLTLNDLHVNIRAERLQQVIDDDATILDDAEASALAVVKDALSSRYDVTNIFDQTDRPAQVVRWVRNIMLYDIAGRLPEKMVSERIVKNYDDTIQVLTDIEEGRKSTSLPILSDNTEGGKKSVFRWGSNAPRKHS